MAAYPTDDRLSLREATCQALRLGGRAVFDDTGRFISYVLDLADGDSPEMKVLQNSLDDVALKIYRECLDARDQQILVRASHRVCTHFVDELMMQEAPSRSAAESIAWGIGDWLGIAMPALTATSVGTTGSFDTLGGTRDFTRVVDPMGGSSGGVNPMGGSRGGVNPMGGSSGGVTVPVWNSSSGSSGGSRPSSLGNQRPSSLGNQRPSSLQTPPIQQRPVQQPVQQQAPPPPSTHTGLIVGVLALVTALAVAAVFLLMSNHTITFSGGGGTGSMSSVTAKGGETITVPSNKYERSGYEFSYWKSSKGEALYEGDAYKVPWIGDVTLTAVWSAEGGLAENVGTATEVASHSDDGSVVRIIRYTNNNDVSIDLTVSADLLNESGTTVDEGEAGTFYGIAPGESVLVNWLSKRQDVDKVRSHISAVPSECDSLAQILSCKEITRGDSGLTLRITNEGTRAARNVGVAVFAKSGDSFCYWSTNITENGGTIEPGESTEVLVEVPSYWLDFGYGFDYYFWGKAG